MLACWHDSEHWRLARGPDLAGSRGPLRGRRPGRDPDRRRRQGAWSAPAAQDRRAHRPRARPASARAPAVVAAPVVGFGHYPAFTPFAGSQHLSTATFKALVGELLGNLRAHGVRRIVLLNT